MPACSMDNLEGADWGHPLPMVGVLLLVSDNNFNPLEVASSSP